MSLLIDEGLVLTSSGSTDRNTLGSSGNNLQITTNNGNIRFQTTNPSGIIFTRPIDFGGTGGISNLFEMRGRNASGTIALLATNSSLLFRTNATTQLQIQAGGAITFTNNPRLLTAASSSSSTQLMSMNNCMTTTTFTPTMTGNSGGVATIDTGSSYGRYTRIGDIIWVAINIVLTSIGTIGAAEDVRIGLPVTSTGATQTINISKITNLNMATRTSCFDILPFINASNSFFTLKCHLLATDNDVVDLNGSQIDNNTEFSFSGFYFV